MKFEEILPLMRDKGKIGIWNKNEYKFQNGYMSIKKGEGRWESISFMDSAFTTDDWSLKPEEVEVWDWVLGKGDGCFEVIQDVTEKEAEKGRINHRCDWKVKLEPTKKLVVREEK